ncbi:hypothetical protein Acr_10g0010630 [Actinidia rufa]|uniref:Uncharacterized protein n=1 Tax=Actinidia rufa TaxID=165716 RepID=A0A7J0FAE9_9ERIC|nr:hypothetical protein Acr_10g0010630 [Actinidia rufa]
MSGEEDNIEAAAAAASRRERLRALKAAQDLLNAPDDDHTDVNPNDQQESALSLLIAIRKSYL